MYCGDIFHVTFNMLMRYNQSHNSSVIIHTCFNTLRPRQNGRHFQDDIFKYMFLNENLWIPIKISLKFVPKGRINNIPTFVQIMAWRRPGDKPLSEPMMVISPTHRCVTRPQWFNISHSVPNKQDWSQEMKMKYNTAECGSVRVYLYMNKHDVYIKQRRLIYRVASRNTKLLTAIQIRNYSR